MPLGPTGHEFWPEYNFGVFAQKLVGCLFWCLRKNWKNLLQEKKNPIKISSEMPLGPTSHEFWPKYNFGVFARKIVDRIFKMSKNQMEKSF